MVPHFRDKKPIADSCHYVYESFVHLMEWQARARLDSPRATKVMTPQFAKSSWYPRTATSESVRKHSAQPHRRLSTNLTRKHARDATTLFALNYCVNPLGSKRRQQEKRNVSKRNYEKFGSVFAALQSAPGTPQIANMRILSFAICDPCRSTHQLHSSM
jgi:hypothetical protein